MKSFPIRKTAAIVLGAGKGTRAKLGFNKMFFPLGDKTVLETSVDKFRQPYIDTVVVVAASDDLEYVTKHIPDLPVIAGGRTRSDSVRNALKYLDGEGNYELVLIHDGARPFVTEKLIKTVIRTASEKGSAVPALEPDDALKEVVNRKIRASLRKEYTRASQTPQCFDYARLRYAYGHAIGDFGDDAEVYERAGYDTVTVPGEYGNEKLTHPHQFLRAEFARIGTGTDVHRTEEGRKLVLGGVTIPFKRGLVGHSDADVVLHAVTDAVLAAAGLPDIGVMFPDTDPQYEGIDSAILLARALKAADAAGVRPTGVSVSIAAEAPKLAPHIRSIRASLAKKLRLDIGQVSVSATTTENLGVIADGQGIAATAVVQACRYKLPAENPQEV